MNSKCINITPSRTRKTPPNSHPNPNPIINQDDVSMKSNIQRPYCLKNLSAKTKTNDRKRSGDVPKL